MTNDQLRQALRNLKGERDVALVFVDAPECIVAKAMLIPDEDDHLVKLTDGRREFVIDAERVAWVRLG